MKSSLIPVFKTTALALSLLALSAATAEAAPNKKPTVKISRVPPVNEQTLVNLNATASDKDGTISSYQWAQLSGPSISFSNPNQAQTSFTSPLVKKTTRVILALTVTDDGGAKTTAKITVTVKPVNTPPIANAGANRGALTGSVVKLNGSRSSDSDGEIKTWAWQQVSGPKVKLFNAKTQVASFTAPSKLTPLKFRLTVTDDEKRKNSADIVITPQTKPNIALNLDAQSFTANEAIAPGTSKNLLWTITNNSNTPLNKVLLNPGTPTGYLTVGAINPASIDNWEPGESKSFSVLVSADPKIATGTHAQSWTFTYDQDSKSIAFNSLGFSLTTQATATAPTNLSLAIATKDFTDGSTIARNANGTINKTLTWTVTNTSDTDLSNVTVKPGTQAGTLNVGDLNPDKISSWAKGETRTFSVTLTGSSTIGADSHSQTWNFVDGLGHALPFSNGQALSFALNTTSDGQCIAGNAAAIPTANAAAQGYSKISATGTALTASAGSWACVYDRNNGLMWEAKTDDTGLHDKDWTYNWYQSGTTSPGTANQGNCGANLDCDTHSFVTEVNLKGLCGYHDWRLPTDDELLSLVSSTETEPAIDGNYFPLTQQSMYWSSTENGPNAWYVSFGRGYHGLNSKDSPRYVRLVRTAK